MKGLLKSVASQDLVRILTIPEFLYFTFSVVFSQMAINMMHIVLIFLIFHLTQSTFSVSILVLTFLVPQVVLSFLGGIYADLSNRRTILLIGNVARAAIILLLFINYQSPLIVYIVALAISIVSQFYIPAETPLIPNLVQRKHLIAANSIFGISLFGSILVGYVLAGPLIQNAGRSTVFLILSGLFVVAAFFTFLIPKRAAEPEHHHTGEVSNEIKQSLREEIQNVFLLLRYSKEAGSAFFLLSFSQVVIWVLATVIPGYAQQILQVQAEDLSLYLFAPAALGMIISSLLVGSLFAVKNKDKLMNIGIFLSALTLLSFPALSYIAHSIIIDMINFLLPRFIHVNAIGLVFLVAFVAGFANALIAVPAQTIIQTVVPESSRSKIYGLLFAIVGAFSLIPIILAGGIADIFGVGSVMVIMGVVIFSIGLYRVRPMLTFK